MLKELKREFSDLQDVFPEVTQSDLYELENWNIAAKIFLNTTQYNFPEDEFEILIEYVEEYPEKPPKVWLFEPELPDDTPHVWQRNQSEHARIGLGIQDWTADMTTHDALLLTKQWISAFETWRNEDVWGEI